MELQRLYGNIISYSLVLYVSMGHACIAYLITAINIITTIINMRAPGQGLHKMPLFVWAMLGQSVIIILCIPVLAGTNRLH